MSVRNCMAGSRRGICNVSRASMLHTPSPEQMVMFCPLQARAFYGFQIAIENIHSGAHDSTISLWSGPAVVCKYLLTGWVQQGLCTLHLDYSASSTLPPRGAGTNAYSGSVPSPGCLALVVYCGF